MEYLSIVVNQKGNVIFFPALILPRTESSNHAYLGKKTGMDDAGKNNFRDNLHNGLVGVVRMGFGV